MIELVDNQIPYELLEANGLTGLFSWYETLGIENEDGKIDVTRICVCPETMVKIIDALCLYSGEEERCAMNMTMLSYGPSGFHKKVPLDEFRIKEVVVNE